MNADVSTDSRLRERFLREGQTALRLSSVHTLRVYRVGTHFFPFIVSERLEGMSMADWLRKHGPVEMPPTRFVSWMRQAIEGLADLHDSGLIHRDLKPANLFLATDATDGQVRVKVIDFGCVKDQQAASDQRRRRLTRKGEAFGSPSYMPPEQIKNAEVTEQADVWALGVTMFEMLTKRRPFEATHVRDVFQKILNTPAPSVSRYRADVPKELEAIVARCLERDRAVRYKSLADVDRAFVAAGLGLGGAAGLRSGFFLRHRIRRRAKRAAPIVIAAAVVILSLVVAAVIVVAFGHR